MMIRIKMIRMAGLVLAILIGPRVALSRIPAADLVPSGPAPSAPVPEDPAPSEPVPEDPEQVEAWFKKYIHVPYEKRKAQLDPELVSAQDHARVIRVRKDGSGDFKTIKEAVTDVPDGNTKRVIISIGPGEYKEKITIEKTQPFVTFFGDPEDNPVIVFGGTALKYGTVDSATVICLGAYFVGVNVIFANSAPRPTPELKGAQAVAVRVAGNKSAFYKCRFLGFQDTLCDNRGFHFYKDNYIQGTVDYIFGRGTSMYLNNELRTLGDEQYTFITAQAREQDDDTGFVFIHNKCTGIGTNTFLGRSWMVRARVLFAYTHMEEVIDEKGWTTDDNPDRALTVVFREYKNRGPGSKLEGRAEFVKQMSDKEVAPYLTLDYVQALTWLLPPPVLQPDGSFLQK